MLKLTAQYGFHELFVHYYVIFQNRHIFMFILELSTFLLSYPLVYTRIIFQLTVADLACFDILDKIIPRADNDIFQSTPSLKEHYKKVMTHPRVQAWLEKRPKTEI